MPKLTKRAKPARPIKKKGSAAKLKSASSKMRVQRHRDKLRAAGLKPVQMWVWDTSRPGFAEECRRQSLMLRDDPHEKEIMDWLEAVADTDGWK